MSTCMTNEQKYRDAQKDIMVDGHLQRPLPTDYFYNRVFLLRSYLLKVAPQKYDVLIIEQIFAQVVLRTSNFQGAYYTQTNSSETLTLYCIYCSSLNSFACLFKNHIELFSTFLDESQESEM